jgi:hypothetical protein
MSYIFVIDIYVSLRFGNFVALKLLQPHFHMHGLILPRSASGLIAVLYCLPSYYIYPGAYVHIDCYKFEGVNYIYARPPT